MKPGEPMGRDRLANRDLPQDAAAGARNGVYKGLSRPGAGLLDSQAVRA